jgi:WD40 repeat protein
MARWRYALGLAILTWCTASPSWAQEKPFPGEKGKQMPEKAANALEVAPFLELRAPRGGYPGGLVFSQDGKLIASGAGSAITIWNAEDGKELARLQLPKKSYSFNMVFASDAKTLIVCGYEDDMMRIFEVRTGKQTHEFRQPRPGGQFLGFSADGKRMAAQARGFRKGVDIFEADTGKLLLHLAEPEDCGGVDFSVDGKLIATVSREQRGLRVWDSRTGKMVKQVSAGDGKLPGALVVVKFSPDGKFLVTAGHCTDARVWHIATGKQLCSLGESCALRTFAPNSSSLLAANGNGASLYHLVAEKVVCSFNLNPVARQAYFACFSPDFKIVAVIGESTLGGEASNGPNGQGSVFLFRVPAKAFEPTAANIDDGPLENLWADLNTDNDVRLQVVLRAYRAAPKPAVALVAKKITPSSKDTQRQLQNWIANFDDESFLRRDEAMEKVQSLAHEFAPLLKKKLSEAQPGELRNRLTFVLDNMKDEKLPSLMVTQRRAIDLLESMATTEARDLLNSLSNGADGAWLTTTAKAALDRLKAKVK